ncbi:hypothetical protein KXD40_000730 [Peronospora effusa]|nr:hypothetical protein KXD40_000730 [Peronospora effusa]
MQRLAKTSRLSLGRLSLGRLLQQQPIEDIPELRSILAVQNLVAKIPENPFPRCLNKNDAYCQWIKTYCSINSLTMLDKETFGAFVKEAGVYLQTQEDEAFQDCGNIGPMEEEELISPKADAFVKAVKIKLARHMCIRTAASFELLDKDKDGERCYESTFIKSGYLTYEIHINHDVPQGLFHLYDADGDDVVNEAESKLILDSMIQTQKVVMTEIFATHVHNLPKKHEKCFAKSMVEEDFKSKIPEKVRCVFHFANKLDKERKTYDWELFEDSKKVEFPELHNMLAVYAKGFYDEREFELFNGRAVVPRLRGRTGLFLQ